MCTCREGSSFRSRVDKLLKFTAQQRGLLSSDLVLFDASKLRHQYRHLTGILRKSSEILDGNHLGREVLEDSRLE